MRMLIDEYTGEPYDADKWYRGPCGCWVNKEAENKFREECARRFSERCDKRNASRVAKGKRRRSPSSFRHSSSRYEQYCREDTGQSFGEWLRDLKYRRRY